MNIEPIRWQTDRLELLDQRLLPAEERYVALHSASEVADAIRDMVVRGAPAIGIAAAYGMALAARQARPSSEAGESWQTALAADLQQLANARPTAVNLFWALDRVRAVLQQGGPVAERLLALARELHREDADHCLAIGRHGATLLGSGQRLYTHCNTGALATGGTGTALGVIREAHRQGRLAHVHVGETRPWWQGARLTAWELQREGIPFSLCIDSAAAQLMARGEVDWVIVGADRIAANGDTANKIGTYGLAVLARHHGVGFMVAAPTSTLDLDLADHSAMPIEQRPVEEITRLGDRPLAPEHCPALNPGFDITPAGLIDALVTERGVIEAPDRERIARHLQRDPS